MSWPASPPSTVAERSSPLTVTVTVSAPATTWALVRMWPVGVEDDAGAGALAVGLERALAPDDAGRDRDDRRLDAARRRRRRRSAPVAGVIAVGTASVAASPRAASPVERPATNPLAPPATTAARVSPAAAANRCGRRASRRERRPGDAGGVGNAGGRGPGGEGIPGARWGTRWRLHRRPERRLGAGEQRIEHASSLTPPGQTAPGAA